MQCCRRSELPQDWAKEFPYNQIVTLGNGSLGILIKAVIFTIFGNIVLLDLFTC